MTTLNIYNLNNKVKKLEECLNKQIDALKTITDKNKSNVEELLKNSFQKIDKQFDIYSSINDIKLQIFYLNKSLEELKERVELKTTKNIEISNIHNEIINFITIHNFRKYTNILVNLGCEKIEDLLLLTQEELEINGVLHIHAKKLLEKAKDHIESNSIIV